MDKLLYFQMFADKLKYKEKSNTKIETMLGSTELPFPLSYTNKATPT